MTSQSKRVRHRLSLALSSQSEFPRKSRRALQAEEVFNRLVRSGWLTSRHPDMRTIPPYRARQIGLVPLGWSEFRDRVAVRDMPRECSHRIFDRHRSRRCWAVLLSSGRTPGHLVPAQKDSIH